MEIQANAVCDQPLGSRITNPKEKTMRKLAKRASLAAASAAVACAAVVGAGAPASAAAPASAHVQRPTAAAKGDDHYRWDNGVGYLRNVEEGYCWDGNRGWHYCWGGHRGQGHGDRFTDAVRYGRDGHSHR
jgi:hypothetical protein